MGKLFQREGDGCYESSPLGERDGILRVSACQLEDTFGLHVVKQPEHLIPGNQGTIVNVVGGGHGLR